MTLVPSLFRFYLTCLAADFFVRGLKISLQIDLTNKPSIPHRPKVGKAGK